MSFSHFVRVNRLIGRNSMAKSRTACVYKKGTVSYLEARLFYTVGDKATYEVYKLRLTKLGVIICVIRQEAVAVCCWRRAPLTMTTQNWRMA